MGPEAKLRMQGGLPTTKRENQKKLKTAGLNILATYSQHDLSMIDIVEASRDFTSDTFDRPCDMLPDTKSRRSSWQCEERPARTTAYYQGFPTSDILACRHQSVRQTKPSEAKLSQAGPSLQKGLEALMRGVVVQEIIVGSDSLNLAHHGY